MNIWKKNEFWEILLFFCSSEIQYLGCVDGDPCLKKKILIGFKKEI